MPWRVRILRTAGVFGSRVARGSLWFVAGAPARGLAVTFGFTLYEVQTLPPWHTDLLREEFSALRDADLEFNGHLQREAKLFDGLRDTVAAWGATGEAFACSRFNPSGMPDKLADGAPYNRSFRLAMAQPKG